MEKTCVVCHVEPAVFRCIQCHKPVCDSCAFKSENGAFCSRQCANTYRAYKTAPEPVRAKGAGGIFKLIGAIVVLAVLAWLAWKMDWIPQSWKRELGENVIQPSKEAAETTDSPAGEPPATE